MLLYCVVVFVLGPWKSVESRGRWGGLWLGQIVGPGCWWAREVAEKAKEKESWWRLLWWAVWNHALCNQPLYQRCTHLNHLMYRLLMYLSCDDVRKLAVFEVVVQHFPTKFDVCPNMFQVVFFDIMYSIFVCGCWHKLPADLWYSPHHKAIK